MAYLRENFPVNKMYEVVTYLITIAGNSMFEMISEKYIAANVNVPAPASLLTELCRLAVPWNAVKWIMKAKPRTKMFRLIRHFSFVPKTTAGSAIMF